MSNTSHPSAAIATRSRFPPPDANAMTSIRDISKRIQEDGAVYYDSSETRPFTKEFRDNDVLPRFNRWLDHHGVYNRSPRSLDDRLERCNNSSLREGFLIGLQHIHAIMASSSTWKTTDPIQSMVFLIDSIENFGCSFEFCYPLDPFMQRSWTSSLRQRLPGWRLPSSSRRMSSRNSVVSSVSQKTIRQ